MVGDRGHIFVGFSIAFMVVSTVAVALRFWSRAVQIKGRFWWDDWVTLMAWGCGMLIDILGIAFTHYGLGRHIVEIPHSTLIIGMKIDFAKSLFFNLGVGMLKLAALFFYLRIFARSTKFTWTVWITQGLVICWMTAFEFTLIFNCNPIAKFWDPTLPGHCINFYRWYMGSGIIDLVLDLWVILLPLPQVWNLKMNPAKKIRVTLAFFFGYLAIVPSLGRFISTAVLGPNIKDDFLYKGMANFVLSDMEIPFAVVSLCIPNFFNLYKHFRSRGYFGKPQPQTPEDSERSRYIKITPPRSDKSDEERASSAQNQQFNTR